MKFGDVLKLRRTTLGWTQPEAAAQIGIEQSYLSKLETGKSLPSEDVYQRLVATYSISAEDLADSLFPGELDRLRDIAAVRRALLARTSRQQRGKQRWLVGGVMALALGGGLLGLSQVGHGGTVQFYTYQSTGVVLPGEPLDVFEDVATEQGTSVNRDLAERHAELSARIDERMESIETYRGPSYVESLPAGRRVWRLVGGHEDDRIGPYRLALMPGGALVLAGLGCLFVGWRWG